MSGFNFMFYILLYYVLRWYHASVITHDDASVPHPAAADGPPAPAAACARGAPWSHPTAAAAATSADAGIPGSASPRQHASCQTNTAKPSQSTEKTIGLAEHHRAGWKP